MNVLTTEHENLSSNPTKNDRAVTIMSKSKRNAAKKSYRTSQQNVLKTKMPRFSNSQRLKTFPFPAT